MLQRRVQLLIDGRAHLLEFLRIVAAQEVQALLDGCTNRLQSLLIGLRQRRELLMQRTRELAQVAPEFVARGLGGLRRFGS